MSVKTVNLLSWSSTILLIFILCFVKQVQISNAYAYCQYYKPNTPWPYFKECPFTCCPKSRSIRENTTCCNPPTEETAIITIFGYRWWTVFLCASCIIIALILLANINKRLHIFKNFKNFNSAVNPASPYTISTNDSNNNDVYKFSTKDDTIILEQHPPCYKDVAPSTQPPYASVNPPTKTDLE